MTVTQLSSEAIRNARPACLRCENPHRLASLWDIVNHFKASDFCLRVGNMAIFEARFQYCDPALSVQEWAQLCIEFAGQIIHAANDCSDIGMTHAWAEIDRVNSSLATNQNSAGAHATAARHIKNCLVSELGKRKFLYVHDDYGGYVDQAALFGEEVAQAFPSAAFDITEAGNCIASECSTAAVFHLMRAAEWALRALARDRRVQLPKKGTLDLATWEEVIRQLEIAESTIQGYPKTGAREAQFKFYHGAMLEFRAFKNKFRNGIMHTRDSYDRDEARSAFVHVRDFMKILAARISEKHRTPLIWKKL